MAEEHEIQETEVPLLDYLDVVRRRKAIIIQTFVVAVAIGFVVTFLTKPVYRSATRILVEGKDVRISQVNANDPLSGLFTGSTGHDVATQLEVLQSDEVIKSAFVTTGVPRRDVTLTAHQVEDTDVIEITSDSTDPHQAESLARQVPQTYLSYVAGSRKTEVVNALAFAKDRYQQENGKLLYAERQMQEFRRAKKIGSIEAERTRQTTAATSSDTAANMATTAAAGAQARLQALEAARARLAPTLEVPTTTTNPQIEITRNASAQLRTDRSRALVLYKPGHAEIQKLDAQLADMERRLASLPANITSIQRTPNPALLQYDDKINEARSALAQTDREMQNARSQAATSNSNLSRYSVLEVQQAQLERVVDRQRSTVQQLAASVQDLSLREKATHDPVLVVQPASLAQQIAPRKSTNLLLSIILGLMLGFGFAMLQEYLDDRINSPEDARQIAGVPAVGYIPEIANADERILIGKSGGFLLESCRVLRSAVQFATVDSPASSLMVTSSAPQEGKSTVAANLAVAMAMDGKRVILVDTDLRRPTVHKTFKLDHEPGLTDVLIGRIKLEEALQDTATPGLRVLSAGPMPPNPAELLGSRAMHALSETLKGMVDLVIYDTPPCLATADAQVLASQTDGVLFVTMLESTRRSGMRHAMEMLWQARANVIGVVINKVDTNRRRDHYGQYGYYGYYGYYSQYATDAEGQLEGEGTERRRRRSHRNGHGSGDSDRRAIAAGVRDDEAEG